MTYNLSKEKKKNKKSKQPGVALAVVKASWQRTMVGLHRRHHMEIREAKGREGLSLTYNNSLPRASQTPKNSLKFFNDLMPSYHVYKYV